MHTYEDKDRYYLRNVFGISTVEFFWGLGLPVVLESTFLQLFLKNLGASSLAIGFIPFFLFIGESLFALLSSYATSKMLFKRGAVFGLHLGSAISLSLFGAILLAFSEGPTVVGLFFICYGFFSLCIGMTIPVWLNYLVIIFSARKTVSGLGYMMIAQYIGKLIGSLVIVKVVEKYAFSVVSSAVIFLAVGFTFALGACFFFMTREAPSQADRQAVNNEGFWPHIRQAAKHIMRNKNYLRFLAGDLEFFIVITVISFYANYATSYCGIAPAVAAGLFVACSYCGAILANISLGSFNLLTLKQKALLSKTVSMAAMGLLLVAEHRYFFYSASFLLGISRGSRMLIYAPAVKRLGGLADSTPYFAISPIITLPVAAGLPLLCGHFLDRFAWLQADSYRLVFASALVMLLGTLICVVFTDFKEGAMPPASPVYQKKPGRL